MADVPTGHSLLENRERYLIQPNGASHLNLRNGPSSASLLQASDNLQTQQPQQSQQQQQQPSEQPEELESQQQRVTSISPPSLTLTPTLSEITSNLHSRIATFLSEPHEPTTLLYRVQQQTRTSLNVIQEALTRHPLSDLSLSYNGGKDCLVLLILFLASLHPLPNTQDGGPNSIPSIYAQPRHPFESVEEFVTRSAEYYHLSLMRYPMDPPKSTMRSTFAAYLEKKPNVKAIFVGTRRTDPHGEKLTHFDRTDHGWPDFLRVHPVIDWHYVEIWAFIRHLGVEYCPLYDQGYTSLGGTNDTHPNPKLRMDKKGGASSDEPSTAETPDKSPRYRPAYELMDDDEERLGRR